MPSGSINKINSPLAFNAVSIIESNTPKIFIMLYSFYSFSSNSKLFSIFPVLSKELLLTIIISKSWNDWLIILNNAFSKYLSILYAGMQTDK